MLEQSIKSLVPELIDTRHHLHQNPELSDHEEQTAAFVAERLRALGLDVRTGVGGNGLVASLQGARPGKTIAIRADMDALPILEQNAFAYRSRNEGVMHACGHDGHTSILLGTARLLTGNRDRFAGEIRFIFQPAEENVGGARRMCRDGVMDGVDAIIALHGWPDIGIGQIGVRAGAMMASADTFDITIKGRGGHAAYPHRTVDPILVGSEVVSSLQRLASREIDPNHPVVVTVTQFHAGTAYNVIPETASLCGTYRTLSAEVRALLPGQITRVAEGVCASAGATCDVSFKEGTPPVINDPGLNALIAQIGKETLGEDNVIEVPYSSMGAEDFAFYLEHAPGAMFRLGLGKVSPIHTPTFDFADDALPIGVELFCRTAIAFLGDEQ